MGDGTRIIFSRKCCAGGGGRMITQFFYNGTVQGEGVGFKTGDWGAGVTGRGFWADHTRNEGN